MKKRVTKILAVLLATVMAASASVVAFADTNEELLAQYYAALERQQANQNGNQDNSQQASVEDQLAQYYAALAKQQAKAGKARNGSVVTVTDATFDAEVSFYMGGLVLVDFSATWCGPCQSMKPILKKIAKNHPEYKIVEMDVDTNNIPNDLGIDAIPFFLFVKNGIIQDYFVGACSEKDMLKMLKKYA